METVNGRAQQVPAECRRRDEDKDELAVTLLLVHPPGLYKTRGSFPLK